MSSGDLPERQIYYLLKKGERDPIGPYGESELVELLNQGEIEASDYIYHPELSGWTPLSQVFNIGQRINHFGEEGQDPQVTMDSFTYVTERSVPDEEILYIAVQHLPALSLTAAVKLTSPKSLVITNQRICVVAPRLMGAIDFHEYPLTDIDRVTTDRSGKTSKGTCNLILNSGESLDLDKIPVEQLAKIEELAGKLLS